MDDSTYAYVYEERYVSRKRGATVGMELPIARKARNQIANSHWLSILDDIKEVHERPAQSDALSAFEDHDLDIHEETQEEEEIDFSRCLLSEILSARYRRGLSVICSFRGILLHPSFRVRS